MLYEGGIRVPFIIHWKNNINPGICKQTIDCNDLFPTLLDMTNKPYDLASIDGQSLVPLISDRANTEKKYNRESFFWHYPLNVKVNNPDDNLPLTPHSAIRKGNYKLIVEWAGNVKLYNIKEDISEQQNLYPDKKALADSLLNELIFWIHSNVDRKYYPQPNPDYNAENDERTYNYPDLIKKLQ